MRFRLTAVLLLTVMIGVAGCRVGRGVPSAPVELSVVGVDGEEIRSWDAQWAPKPERLGGVVQVGSQIRWSAVAEGDYEVTVTAPGYQTTTLTITVVEDVPVDEQVNLRPAG